MAHIERDTNHDFAGIEDLNGFFPRVLRTCINYRVPYAMFCERKERGDGVGSQVNSLDDDCISWQCETAT